MAAISQFLNSITPQTLVTPARFLVLCVCVVREAIIPGSTPHPGNESMGNLCPQAQIWSGYVVLPSFSEKLIPLLLMEMEHGVDHQQL